MKIARLMPLKAQGSKRRRETYGLIGDDGMLASRDEIAYATGVPVPRHIQEFLFDGCYDEIQNKELVYHESLDDFELLSPLPSPSKVICLAFNYEDHAQEQGLVAPSDPALVIKPRTAITGTKTEIPCPDFVRELDYEVELALVIRDRCKNVAASSAPDHVFGYMVFNDLSARDIQFADKQFTRGKGFDGFAPCGPWITTTDAVDDVDSLRLTTRINGETRQDSSTRNMVIKIPEIVSKISQVMTLEPGDIISTGTPAGVMLNKPGAVFLGDGDLVEVEIEGLGAVSNVIRKVPVLLQ